jgi:hypothetical protein
LNYDGISHWDIVRQGVPQGSILGVLRFLFYVNDLPTIFNNSVKSVLSADDASFVIGSDNNLQYRNEVSISFTHLNAWFNSNFVRFDVFMAVTMKNAVLWDVTPCGCCKNRRFEGT